MIETILQVHEDLQKKLRMEDIGLPDPSQIESCFQEATTAWQKVRDIVRGSGFSNDADEIEFFKVIKARFTGLLEYYLNLFRYQVYATGDKTVVDKYLQEELQRFQQFRDKHATFIRYLNEGRTDWDNLYFLRRNLSRPQRPASQVYDRMSDLWTNGDWIVTLHTGFGLFEQFLQKQGASVSRRDL